MKPEILYRVTDMYPFYLWEEDGLYRSVEKDDGHYHRGYTYSELIDTGVFTDDLNNNSQSKIDLEKIDLENIDSIREFLKKVQQGHISCRKGSGYILDAGDKYWFDGVKTGREGRTFTILKLSEMENLTKYKNFIELVSNGKRPDGTYNYCREALEKLAKELLK